MLYLNRCIKLHVVLVMAPLFVLIGCQRSVVQTTPVVELYRVDFYPVKRLDSPAPHGFCDRVPDRGLRVSVGNDGTSTASTTVAVEYSFGQTRFGTTPPIPAGQNRSVVVDEPSPPGGDWEFIIRVDPNGTVTELDEGNNTAEGYCIG